MAAWVTGYDRPSNTVFAIECDDSCVTVEKEMDRYKEFYSDVTCWAVAPSFENEHFKNCYYRADKIAYENNKTIT